MNKLIRILLLIATIASVCSIDRTVPDSAIMGKWVGAGTVVLLSILFVSIVRLVMDCRNGVASIGAGDMFWPFTLAGLAVMVHCYLQLSGVLKHAYGNGDGAFAAVAGFDNPAGVAAALTVCLPFMTVKAAGSKRPVLSIWVLMTVFLLSMTLMVLIGSRAGLISIGTVLVFFIIQDIDDRKVKRILLIVAVITVATVAVVLTVHKKASNTGRMLILNVCRDMINERPLLGHGLHGFRSQYMNFQALYLERCRSTVMDMLADNVTHPLNEYVLVAVNFGMAGITALLAAAVVIVRHYLRHPSRDGFTGIMVMAGIAVLSLFSYPFRYPLTSVALACALVLVFREPILKFTDSRRRFFSACTLLLSIAGLFLFMPWAVAQHRWGKVSLATGHVKETEREYAALYRRLKKDPYFLYNYAYLLADAGKNRQALQTAGESLELMSNYDTVLFMAEQESLCGDTDNAEQHYLLASRMCPVRFIPLYGLFCLYEEQGRFDEMKSIGQRILNKRIKVKSPEVSRIRLAVRQGMMMHNL